MADKIKKIGVLAGSLRRDSYSKSVARALSGLTPEGLELVFIEIGDLPLYSEDLDVGSAVPAPWVRLRAEVGSCDGFLFVTPEYNRSIPAALKNALDVGSRPYGQSVWNGKPGGVIGVTPGALGAMGACITLRQVLACLNVPALAQPEAYISRVDKLLDGGRLTDESTTEFLKKYMLAFSKFVNAVAENK